MNRLGFVGNYHLSMTQLGKQEGRSMVPTFQTPITITTTTVDMPTMKEDKEKKYYRASINDNHESNETVQ